MAIESIRDRTPRIEGGDGGDGGDSDDDSDDDDDDESDSGSDGDGKKDDKDDSEGGASGASGGSTSSSDTPDDHERRSKKKNDRQSPPPQQDKGKEKVTSEEALDAMPLNRIDTELTRVLDTQGTIQYSVLYDKEEGEIIHCLSKEQIADLFKMNPDEVNVDDQDVPTSDMPSPDRIDDVDDVEIEDITEEMLNQSNDNEDVPSFEDLFSKQSNEELNRKLDEKTSTGPSEGDLKDLEDRKAEWMAYLCELKKKAGPSPPTKHTKVYRLKGYKSSGRIISWAYFNDLHCYGVKRERGIQYFRFPHDFKTLPGFEVNQLARLKLLYSETSNLSEWFEKQLKFECRRRWVNFKPQQPERYIKSNVIDPVSQRPKVILKWKSPHIMKKIPLRKMIQDFSERFRWWYFDGRTAEAVIVLSKDNTWDTIRVFDPMWLTNLSESDVKTLYKCQIFFEVEDMDQALQYMKVIQICYAFDIHAGVSWKEQTAKFLKNV